MPKRYKYELRELVEGSRFTSCTCDVASTRQNIMSELNDMLRSTMPLVKERIRATNEYERVKTLIRMAYEFGRAEQEYGYAFRDGLKHWRRAHGSTEEAEEW